MITVLFDKIMGQAEAEELYVEKLLSNIAENRTFSNVDQGISIWDSSKNIFFATGC